MINANKASTYLLSPTDTLALRPPVPLIDNVRDCNRPGLENSNQVVVLLGKKKLPGTRYLSILHSFIDCSSNHTCMVPS